MSEAVLERIRQLLDLQDSSFEEIEHAEVRSAEEAALARRMPLEQGAKSLLFKADDAFGIYVMSGARKMRSRQVRRHLGVRRTRFATADELTTMIGVPKGAVPPFGRPIFELPLYADPSVLEQDTMAFTAGVRTVSIVMRSRDWQAIARPELFPFCR